MCKLLIIGYGIDKRDKLMCATPAGRDREVDLTFAAYVRTVVSPVANRPRARLLCEITSRYFQYRFPRGIFSTSRRWSRSRACIPSVKISPPLPPPRGPTWLRGSDPSASTRPSRFCRRMRLRFCPWNTETTLQRWMRYARYWGETAQNL